MNAQHSRRINHLKILGIISASIVILTPLLIQAKKQSSELLIEKYTTQEANNVGWVKIDDAWYYFNSNYVMQTGWTQVGNIWYYMSSDGAMQTDWQKINNNWYYLQSNGAMATGWIRISNRWYYLGNNGAMRTGWVKVGNTWYYLNSNGVMQTGQFTINGTWHYFNAQGAWNPYTKGILIVNKKHSLPANYNPGENLIAVGQLKKLISRMQNLGYDISNSYSGFRTYTYQKTLYERYVQQDGKKAADTYSARPGYSEHQTGLAYDLKHKNGMLVEKTAETNWLAKNAASYGFIVRYKTGKEHITGYQAEPWHLRYVGSEADAIYKSGLTLEEYLKVPGGDYYK